MYSSILLLDKDKNIITRSGTGSFLECLSPVDQNGKTNLMMIPLDQYCSDEQSDLIYKELGDHNSIWTHVQGEISGYSDRWGFKPQKISLKKEGTENTVTLKFDNIPDENVQLDSWNIDDASLWLHGFGQKNRGFTEKDRTIIKECETASFADLDVIEKMSSVGLSGGSSHGVEPAHSIFSLSEATTVTVNGETCYLLIGVQGYPLSDSILYLMPIYIFLFFLMLILFFIVSRSFIKMYEQQAERESARRDLINAIAHELKTPLGIIRSFCEGLKEKINEGKTEHYIDVIQDETMRMDEAILDMLAASQLETDINLSRQKCSLNKIAEQTLTRYHEVLANKGIVVQILSTDDCMINCDAKLMEKVISNFLSNAVRHAPEGGNIKIFITDDNGNIDNGNSENGTNSAYSTDNADSTNNTNSANNSEVTFAIENSGQPIPADKIAHVWDAYYKTDAARSNPKGTGLGLFIVKSILTAHGYKYGVDNTNAGVRFWFMASNA